MSGVIPTVLSPARVSHALASVGPPAGSGGLRISSTDPLTPGNGIDTQRNGSGRAKSTSPSRAAATAFPISAISAGSPLTTDASQATTVPSPAAPYLTTPIHGPSATTTIPIYRASGSGTGESSSAATSARSLNGRRPQTARSFRSRPDSPKTTGGRVQPAPDSSSASISTMYGAYGGGGVLPSPIQRAHASNGGNTRGSRGGLGRDRSFAGSASSATGQIRPQQGSISGGFGSGLESMGAALVGLARGAPVGLQPAPGTAGGIDISRLMAIQRLLDEYDSDDATEPGVTSPRAEGSSYRHRSDSAGGDSARARGSDSGSGTGSASGLRRIASLRSRKDMQHWQPSVSTAKGTLEEHQQRLRERADVTLHLKRWTEQVLEDARRAAEGGTSGRTNEIVRAASVRFKDVPEDQELSLTAALGEYLDPEQELDDEEERRLEALTALPPNPRGLGTQLRAHFMAVVEEEVNKKFDVMRTKWEAEKGNEAEELRELRESYRDLRRMHMETKEALDKANTRMDVMRLQMKATASISKTGKEGASAATDADSNAVAASGTKSSLRSHRSSTHDGNEGKASGKGGKGGSALHTADGSPQTGGYGHEDELHDKLRSIGSRRPTSPTGDGATPGTVELQQQLKAHAESAMTLNRKLQDAEQQLLKLKLDKASLENQLEAARARGGSPDPDAAAGTGATGGGTGTGAGAGNKYDTDVQIFKLKQEKASLEQQLAAAKAKSSAKGGAKGGSGGGSARSGSTSRAMAAVSTGKATAAGKTAELTAEVERLQIELAAAKREAARSTKETMERRMELQKVKDDLATNKTTLEMALQQIAGVKEAMSQEKDRADKAVAAAEAAEAAQAQAEANAAAANSAMAAALIKRSAATGEVQELLERLEKERDTAVTAAAELRQQVRELSASLGRQAEDVMQLREQLLQRQLEKPATSAPPADAEVPPAATDSEPLPPASSSGPAPGPQPTDARGMIPPIQSKVTAAAVAAMQSLGVPLRPTPVAARRRPTSALGPGGSAGATAFEGAVGVAAAAAAAAALVPAVLEVLQQRVPNMVISLGGELEEASAAATPADKPAADADGGAAASVNAAAAAAAAAAATLRESGNAAAAAAAGATAAAPFIASTFVDLVRAELLHNDANTSAQGGAAAAAEAAVAGGNTAPSRPEAIMAGASPSEDLVSEQLDQLSALGGDRLYVFRKGTPPTVVTPAIAGGPSVTFADDSASPSPAATTPAGAADGAAGDRFTPPPAVMVDGVTFYPLGMRESSRTTRRSGALSTILSGGHDLPHSPQRSTPSTPLPLPHHTPYFDAAAAAVAAAAADLIPQTVSVSVQSSRHTLVSSAVTSAARRRKSAFAQLHSSYLTPAAAAGLPPTLDPNSPHSTMPDLPIEDDGDVAAAEMAATAAAAGSGSTGHRGRLIRSAGYYRDAADGALQDPYATVYVDPELASVLHVERVSPATARAAGAGRGAISPEALGPSLRDRALSALQAPEPLAPPQQRPQSAAVRTLDTARQFILHHGNGGGGRYSQPPQSLSAVLPPVAGAMPPVVAAAAAEAPGPAPPEGGPTSAAQPQQPGQVPLGLLMSGVKVRAVPANPQKGVQLSARLRAPRQPSARGLAGRSQAESVRFEDDEAAAAAGTGPSVSGRLVPGAGLGPGMREMQLHMGPQGGATSATYLVSVDPAGGGSDPELPTSGPELAALARGLMAAQERAVRELDEAMSTRRELAEEVLTSRQQWLDEARRARALEKELEGVRAMLVSLGIGVVPPGSAGAGGVQLAQPSLRSSGAIGASPSTLPTLRMGGLE
ncbi:hypothetical protein Vretimale_2786 [Volvox reticuliferus]|uniref:Uncharacterized protein n=1 Tax=Volvox reticuliferus TaxID=1737510 RepID=A0A8J4C809_9CHLO|nr:hypothetical protein Vretifemale_6855 [Volvox reticuliferus]GIL97304.1 hypothetical protein Vretimale_2786 [Volvox reticuliferus]